MAVNVSEIAVRVTGDTVNLQMQMQKGAESIETLGKKAGQSVNRVNGSMKAAQGIAQNAVFAVDDFVASFQTGGIAGGLRGAANNLTFIAAQMGRLEGGIAGVTKQLGAMSGQLALIGGIAAMQFIIAGFEKLHDEVLNKVLERLKLIRDERDALLGEQKNTLEFREELGQLEARGELDAVDQRIQQQKALVRNAQLELVAKHDILAENKRMLEITERQLQVAKELAFVFSGPGMLFVEPLSQPGIQRDALADAIKEASKEADKAAKEFGRLNNELVELFELQLKIKDQQEGFAITVGPFMDENMRQNRIAMEGVEFGMDQFKDLQKTQQGLDALDKRLEDILDPEGKAAREVQEQIEDVNKAFTEGLINEDEALMRIERIRQAAIKELGDVGEKGSLFTGQLPEAARAGSSAAVGSFNRAIGATMNTSFEQKTAMNTQKSAEALKRIEAEIKKGQAIIVGVN